MQTGLRSGEGNEGRFGAPRDMRLRHAYRARPARRKFFIFFGRNPLKSPDSEK
jgi:hypothetical protein